MIPGSANTLLAYKAAGASAYQIQRSLRFNSADSAYLSRTPASAGNQTAWTWAGWVKRSAVDATNQVLFSSASEGQIRFDNTNAIRVLHIAEASLITTPLFRDPSAWSHLVISADTTQATASDRLKIFWNGVQVTQFSTASYPAQNSDLPFNAAEAHSIGRRQTGGTFYFNGYLADIHFIDGQALDPTSFGEFDVNGIWQPKAYSGSYGTNGFHLDFADNSSATALGYDAAGSNDWTPNNLSVAAGSGNDSLVDSPTNYGTDTGAGGEVRGNYCTWNPLSRLGDVTQTLNVSNGNLAFTTSSNGGTTGSVGMSSGKWYWELACSTLTASQLYFGITAATSSTSRTSGVIGIRDTGVLQNAGGATTNGSGTTAYTTGDIVQFAFDADNRRLFVGKNNTWLNSSDPAAGTGASFTDIPAGALYAFISDNSTTATIDANFGQRPFAYTAPSGFKALCTANLPTPTITKGSSVMDVVTYTGTGSTLTPTSSLGFSPDLVWIKGRSGATDHTLYDAVRGAEKRLESNTTDAEVTSDGGLTAFNSNGFTLGTLAQVNTNTATYAAWCWDGGSSTVTNTSGTISSQVRANASAGFSIVTYTGNSTSGATVGHGLGVAPGFVIIKRRSPAGNWIVGHTSSGWGSAFEGLNTTTEFRAPDAKYWNSTAPSSTVLTFGNEGNLNDNGQTFVAYCWAPVAGYSAFGSYTGNGSADGPFVYLGFRPAFVLVKMSSSTSNWTILDTKREGYNVDNDQLFPNSTDAEDATDLIDITSNGFKMRTSSASVNTSTGTYVYAAWAENPFSLARAR